MHAAKITIYYIILVQGTFQNGKCESLILDPHRRCIIIIIIIIIINWIIGLYTCLHACS